MEEYCAAWHIAVASASTGPEAQGISTTVTLTLIRTHTETEPRERIESTSPQSQIKEIQDEGRVPLKRVASNDRPSRRSGSTMPAPRGVDWLRRGWSWCCPGRAIDSFRPDLGRDGRPPDTRDASCTRSRRDHHIALQRRQEASPGQDRSPPDTTSCCSRTPTR